MPESGEGKEFVKDWIDSQAEKFCSYSDAIWEFAELGCEEKRSSELLVTILRENGFEVQTNVAGLPTGFVARWGRGRPMVGFSCEYDAIPGVSQKRVQAKEDPEKAPLVEGAPGHGCGHNLLGIGATLAAIATKEWLSRSQKEGTILVFGTPAEELCIGKPFMARDGIFSGLDAILDWHPWYYNSANFDRMTAYFNVKYHFHGRTAHGNAPWMGRSALDAGMLMAHAIEMLREHMPPGNPKGDVGANTINYTFSNVGPAFPSVVPDCCTVWVVGRLADTDQVRDAITRISKCAEGAAIATGTTWESEFLTATHERIPNKALSKVLYDQLQEMGAPPFTPEEHGFARRMQRQLGVKENGIATDIFPFEEGYCPNCDTGEYSWHAPFATLWLAVLPEGLGWHNWQVTNAAGTSIGKKTMIHAAKILATSCLTLFSDPAVLADAQQELRQRLGGRTYQSLIPEGTAPPLDINRLEMEKYRDLLAKAGPK